ncbi:MAG: hypothetical protein LBF67_01495 [Prevotellaceae bacterium]|jgi:hypothetical protein|nr:hypothetical protein [Prevotellaceae bacterium]
MKEEKWECHTCSHEENFEIMPFGYLGNYHPLCERCADKILFDKENVHHYRLTYHKKIGDIVMKNTIRASTF